MPTLPCPTLCRALLTAALLCAGSATQAAPADYTCEGGAMMQADFSPRAAQLRFEGQKWALRRVRDRGEAHYVATSGGLSVRVVRNQATLERKGQPALNCKLVVRALRPEALGVVAPTEPVAPAPR
jgi:hypothetical protein